MKVLKKDIVGFTICANNYLAHAITLARSFKEFHKEAKFYIVILDRPNDTIDYSDLGSDGIIWADKLHKDLIKQLSVIYGIAELCTVIKPKMIEYFYNSGFNKVLYIDPDIKVYSSFQEVFNALEVNDVVLTPHICSPTGETGHPLDKDLMRTGIYNLGFLAMKKTSETLGFLKWWHKRVVVFGYHDLRKGFFYDQIWLGYAPAFLDKVYVLRHLGYNVANWNLHERRLLKIDETWYVNNKDIPLCFFHFSHYKMENEPLIASYNENFNLENRLDLKEVFNDYKLVLLKNEYIKFKTIDFSYGKKATLIEPKKNKPNRFRKAGYLAKKSILTLIKG